MKKLLSILSICLVFVSCSPDRVLIDELTRKGEVLYFEGKPFNGVSFNVYDDGQLKDEYTYKDGEIDGLVQVWYENGQLRYEWNFKDDELNGLYQSWYENGQLSSKANFKDDELNGLCQTWYENGQLEYERNYKDGVIIN